MLGSESTSLPQSNLPPLDDYAEDWIDGDAWTADIGEMWENWMNGTEQIWRSTIPEWA